MRCLGQITHRDPSFQRSGADWPSISPGQQSCLGGAGAAGVMGRGPKVSGQSGARSAFEITQAGHVARHRVDLKVHGIAHLDIAPSRHGFGVGDKVHAKPGAIDIIDR